MAKSTCTIFDEAGFGREPYIPYSWQDRGTVVKIPGRAGKRINVIGVYSLMAGNIRTEMFERNINSDDVVAFLDKLSEKLEKPSVVMVDNATIHTADKVMKKLPEWEEKGLYVYHLPTYSPELNLIEIVWRMVKYKWLPLKAYSSFSSLWDNLKDVFCEIGRKHILYLAEQLIIRVTTLLSAHTNVP